MMETVFNNRFKFFNKPSIDMVDSILNTDSSIKVSGKTLALEITKQNQAVISDGAIKLILLSAFVPVLPILRGYFLSEPFFLNDHHREAYLANIFPCFLLYWLNLALYNSMTLILHNKMMYA